MTSEYTPTTEQMRSRASLVCHQGGCNIEDSEKRAEFDRFIARVKAEALREALRGFALSPHVSYPGTAVHAELARRSVNIEKEAGL